MKALAAIALAAGLAACAGNSGQQAPVAQAAPAAAPQPETLKPVQLSARQRRALEAGLRRSLKDPESARFGAHRAGLSETGLTTVCGLVNARNSFGGYTGDKPYMASITDKDAVVVIGMGGTDIQTRAVLEVCGRYGLAL